MLLKEPVESCKETNEAFAIQKSCAFVKHDFTFGNELLWCRIVFDNSNDDDSLHLPVAPRELFWSCFTQTCFPLYMQLNRFVAVTLKEK